MDFRDAFVLWRGLGIDYEGGVLANPARVAIHFTHRLGALVAGGILIAAGLLTVARSARLPLRLLGGVLVVAVLLQISIGVAMVHFSFPLVLATMHNGGAALLVLVMTTLLRALWPGVLEAIPPGHRSPPPAWYPCAVSTLPDNPPLATSSIPRWRWREYLELTKPKVSLLIVFTAIVGMVLASPGMVPLPALIFGTLGIALASGSAAAFNHVLDRRIDERMARTRSRPLPTGHLAIRSGGDIREPSRPGIDAGAVADGGQRSRRCSPFSR